MAVVNNRLFETTSYRLDELNRVILEAIRRFKQLDVGIEDVRRFFDTRADANANKEFNQMVDRYISGLVDSREQRKILRSRDDADTKRDRLISHAETAIVNTDEWKAADEAVRRAMKERINAWATITVENLGTFQKRAKDLLNRGVEALRENLGGWVVDLIDAVGSQFSSFIGRRIHATEIAESNRALKTFMENYEKRKELYDREMQARLFALGLIGAATEKQHEEELRKAIESGDQRRIFEAESALKRFQIEEKFAEKQQKLSEEKAELQHDVEMAQWRMNVASAWATKALAILKAVASAPWPANLLAIGKAIATGAVQVANVNSARPPAPSFATGGIVPGSLFRGDRIAARVNSGEMVINRQQQQDLWDFIQNKSQSGMGVGAVIEVPIYLDGNVIAKTTVDYVNNGHYLIKQRGIR